MHYDPFLTQLSRNRNPVLVIVQSPIFLDSLKHKTSQIQTKLAVHSTYSKYRSDIHSFARDHPIFLLTSFSSFHAASFPIKSSQRSILNLNLKLCFIIFLHVINIANKRKIFGLIFTRKCFLRTSLKRFRFRIKPFLLFFTVIYQRFNYVILNLRLNHCHVIHCLSSHSCVHTEAIELCEKQTWLWTSLGEQCKKMFAKMQSLCTHACACVLYQL